MTSGPIDPKATAQAAIARGDLTPLEKWEQYKADNCTRFPRNPIRTPEEAGIAAIIPPPKTHRHQYKKTIPKKSAYVITEKDLLKSGFTRQELQHIKNEVRSQ